MPVADMDATRAARHRGPRLGRTELKGADMDIFELKTSELTRRDFIKIAGAAAALLGLSQALTPRMVKALEGSVGKPAVIWLEGQDCAGCVESFLNSLEPLAATMLLDTISWRYHELIMGA